MSLAMRVLSHDSTRVYNTTTMCRGILRNQWRSGIASGSRPISPNPEFPSSRPCTKGNIESQLISTGSLIQLVVWSPGMAGSKKCRGYSISCCNNTFWHWLDELSRRLTGWVSKHGWSMSRYISGTARQWDLHFWGGKGSPRTASIIRRHLLADRLCDR